MASTKYRSSSIQQLLYSSLRLKQVYNKGLLYRLG